MVTIIRRKKCLLLGIYLSKSFERISSLHLHQHKFLPHHISLSFTLSLIPHFCCCSCCCVENLFERDFFLLFFCEMLVVTSSCYCFKCVQSIYLYGRIKQQKKHSHEQICLLTADRTMRKQKKNKQTIAQKKKISVYSLENQKTELIYNL